MTLSNKLHFSHLSSKDTLLELLAQKLSCVIKDISFLFGYADTNLPRDALEIPDVRLY